MEAIKYPKGYRQNKTITVDLELWTKFKRKVLSEGRSMTGVLMGLIKQWLEENK